MCSVESKVRRSPISGSDFSRFAVHTSLLFQFGIGQGRIDGMSARRKIYFHRSAVSKGRFLPAEFPVQELMLDHGYQGEAAMEGTKGFHLFQVRAVGIE